MCPDVFQLIKSTSNAVELDGTNVVGSDGNIAIKIPVDFLKQSDTKILVLKYTNDKLEISDDLAGKMTAENCYTVPSRDGGYVLPVILLSIMPEHSIVEKQYTCSAWIIFNTIYLFVSNVCVHVLHKENSRLFQ